ncbi:Calsyntenin-1 [Eumeta japonica]|uniref:Calsyntenin-1 n=1 Tax=Eumeta variegata TaxID=151549 RepID=A0A4C1WV36_EUMVA|nr:Calsyntenin-1 [Eumeta japonica]
MERSRLTPRPERPTTSKQVRVEKHTVIRHHVCYLVKILFEQVYNTYVSLHRFIPPTSGCASPHDRLPRPCPFVDVAYRRRAENEPSSDTVPVHITVTDVNEYAPVWSRPAYVRAVDEGRLYDELVRVEATDRDCTPRYGDICKYEIRADPERPQPFTIDNEGRHPRAAPRPAAL